MLFSIPPMTCLFCLEKKVLLIFLLSFCHWSHFLELNTTVRHSVLELLILALMRFFMTCTAWERDTNDRHTFHCDYCLVPKSSFGYLPFTYVQMVKMLLDQLLSRRSWIAERDNTGQRLKARL